jgi:hypothetical protein
MHILSTGVDKWIEEDIADLKKINIAQWPA